MSQDYRAKMECTECRRLNYNTTRNKKRLAKVRLELKKLCTACGKHTLHKETK
ncbi:MAG: 50S ribosomal protein L33 [bacterium]|nr:50S ribosomal protein L33 [bacterium]